MWKNRKNVANGGMKDKVSQKRKVIDDEIQNLKRKRQALQTDVDCVNASADELAQQAESSRDISLTVKSNVMCKVSQDKTTEMTELDKQLADKLLEQKNCE